MPRIVTLTTDFGSGSEYVAELKARLLHAAAPITLVDIAHDVAPHDVRSAAWLVARSCPAFPPGSLHLVVVDPGVGTGRHVVWARIGDREFMAPDNGVLWWAARRAGLAEARTIAVPADAAATFHGRDVMAPAAVRRVDGAAPETLGPVVEGLVTLAWPEPRETAAGIEGEVVHVDSFGNLVTNLPVDLLPRLVAAGRLHVGPHEVGTVVHTYGDAPPGTPVALAGSQGFLEAAVVQGRAAERLHAGVGDRVVLP